MALPAAAWLAVAYFYPVVVMLGRSFTEVPDEGGPLANYQWFFESQVNVRVLTRTVITAGIVSLVCLLGGYAYAYTMTLVSARWRAVLLIIALIPFWTSPVARNFAWVALLQDHGPLNEVLDVVGVGDAFKVGTLLAVIVGMCQVMLPFMILPLYASLSSIDRRLLDAAASLGARPRSAFLSVYLPLSIPGIAAGTVLVFVLSLGFYLTPALLGSPQNSMLSQLLVTQINVLLAWGRGGAMAVMLLVVTAAILALGWLIARRNRGLTSTGSE